MKHVHLTGILVVVLKQVDVHRQRLGARAALLALLRDAGVQRHAVDPRFHIAAVLESLKAPPQVDDRLLKEVVHLVGIFREHVAHSVDGALVLLDGLCKFAFQFVHFLLSFKTFF